MAKLININSAELIRYKERIEDIADSLNKTFVNLNNELDNIANNLVDKSNTSISPLVTPMQNLTAKNDKVGSSMYMRLQEIALFISEQIADYSISTEEAQASLVKLISLIEGVLGITENNAVDGTTATLEEEAGENLENPEVLEPNASSEEILETQIGVDSNVVDTTVIAGDTYKLGAPMNSVYDANAYNEGATDLQVALIQNRMGTVDALNDRMDIIVNSYNYYKSLGYSDELIAGMLGNMCQESTFNLEAVSETGCKGLYQWTEGRAPASWDLQSQLDRSVVEINTRADMSGKTVWERLQNCSTVRDYTEYFAVFFEGAASRVGEVPDIGARTNYANAMYYLIKNNFNV